MCLRQWIVWEHHAVGDETHARKSGGGEDGGRLASNLTGREEGGTMCNRGTP